MNATLTEAPKMYETENDISQNRRSELNADLFTEISRGMDKWLWLVEAHSQATK